MFFTLLNKERSEIEDIVLIDMSIKSEKEGFPLQASGNHPSIVYWTSCWTMSPLFYSAPICSQLSFAQLQAPLMAMEIDTFQLQLSGNEWRGDKSHSSPLFPSHNDIKIVAEKEINKSLISFLYFSFKFLCHPFPLRPRCCYFIWKR